MIQMSNKCQVNAESMPKHSPSKKCPSACSFIEVSPQKKNTSNSCTGYHVVKQEDALEMVQKTHCCKTGIFGTKFRKSVFFRDQFQGEKANVSVYVIILTKPFCYFFYCERLIVAVAIVVLILVLVVLLDKIFQPNSGNYHNGAQLVQLS